MRAIILAGGKGTRLKPYTITLPKPLVPVGGEVPIIYWNEGKSELKVICGQGVAPQAATIAHFRAR